MTYPQKCIQKLEQLATDPISTCIQTIIYYVFCFYCALLLSAGLNGLKAPVAPPLGVVIVFFFLLIGLFESLFFISDGGSFHPCVNSFLSGLGPVGISLGVAAGFGGGGKFGGGIPDISKKLDVQI